MVWNTAESSPPQLLTDGTNSYIYGPDNQPIEQISNGGTIFYIHHDQQGSTRMLTGSAGTSEATFTYSPYGELTGSTGTAKAPLGYDGQYTSSDTGLIYLRARTYDPKTAQFLNVDPLARITRALYTYAQDDPVNRADLTGLCTGFGPALSGCTGSSDELGPHVFCTPTRHEVEQREKEREENYKNEEEESDAQLAGQEVWGNGGNPYGGEPKGAPPEADPE
jgi:RHS repeat-associated protein